MATDLESVGAVAAKINNAVVLLQVEVAEMRRAQDRVKLALNTIPQLQQNFDDALAEFAALAAEYAKLRDDITSVATAVDAASAPLDAAVDKGGAIAVGP